jgi:hypothetical protein
MVVFQPALSCIVLKFVPLLFKCPRMSVFKNKRIFLEKKEQKSLDNLKWKNQLCNLCTNLVAFPQYFFSILLHQLLNQLF